MTGTVPGVDVRSRLRAELTASLKRRDRAVAAALRSAVAAVDNAEAVDPTGVDTTEVARRELSADEIDAILHHEVDDLRTAAEEYAELAQADRAADLAAGAAALSAILDP